MNSPFKFLAVAAATLIGYNAYATVETFDGASGTSGGTYNGFTLSSNIMFYDAGRPYLESFNQAHSITSATLFTFNSLDFNYDPWANYGGGYNDKLHMQLLGATNNVLLDVLLTLPTDRSWLTYSNTVSDVQTIYFEQTGYGAQPYNTGNGFWPSVDNLVYNAASNGNNVPEPGSLALLGLGLAAVAGIKRRK